MNWNREEIPFWNLLTDEEKGFVGKNIKKEKFSKNQIINQNNGACPGALFILEGQLRVYILSEEGREVTLYRMNGRDFCVFSSVCLLDKIQFDAIIEVTKDLVGVVIPTEVLNTVIKNNVTLELYLNQMANARFSDVVETMQQILFMGADRRVARFLWEEMNPMEEEKVICITHEEVAKSISSAREVVTKTLKYMAEEGILELSRGKIKILDVKKLKDIL